MPDRFFLHLVEPNAQTNARTGRRVRPRAPHPPHTRPSPFSHHLLALRRGFFFALAAIALIAPMAVAARHADAGMTLARCWPLDLSAAAPRPMLVPALGAEATALSRPN